VKGLCFPLATTLWWLDEGAKGTKLVQPMASSKFLPCASLA